MARIAHDLQKTLYLGNLDASAIGASPATMSAMPRMLQIDEADDYVVATGETHSVREFCDRAFARVERPLTWEGEGVDERGIGPGGEVLVRVDPGLFSTGRSRSVVG